MIAIHDSTGTLAHRFSEFTSPSPAPKQVKTGIADKTEYCLGFLFDSTKQQVVLIRKKNPEWQRGKLNGLGGKIKPGESAWVAMAREFQEESGVLIAPSAWTHFCTMGGADWKVHCFAVVDDEARARVHSPTEEKISFCNVETIIHSHKLIPNLKWLLPLAIEALTCEMSADVNYRIVG